MRLVWFTANAKGGVYQFAVKLHETALELGHESYLIAPDDSALHVKNGIPFKLSGHCAKVSEIRSLSRLIENLVPDFVMFADDPLTSLRVLNRINSRGRLKTMQFVHDVSPHTTNAGLRQVIRARATLYLREKAMERSAKIVLMSKNSLDEFKRRYNRHAYKGVLLPLGAHVLTEEAKCPSELGFDMTYLLFFGRIDKYKGIARLLRAWARCNHAGTKLLIAGGGTFSNEEKALIEASEDLSIINRFIDDEEMNYLIINACAVILPYTDATQSGVIPISYHHGTCVIAADIPGLNEYVVDGVTGNLAASEDDLVSSMQGIIDHPDVADAMGANAHLYALERLDWAKNLSSLLCDANTERA